MINFGRDICGDLANAERREWIVTNGIGGYASGTVAGLLTRRYHGLLVAALQPPIKRTLLVSKFDETVIYAGRDYALFSNRWAGDVITPHGYHYLERFHLEGTTPVWTFALADALLEKRIWMQPGANTTYIQYHLRRLGVVGEEVVREQPLHSAPFKLMVKAFVNYRNFHGETHHNDWRMQIDHVGVVREQALPQQPLHGLKISPYDGADSFYLLTNGAEAIPQHDWYRNFLLAQETFRGFEGVEDHLYVGDFRAELRAGESLTIVVSTEPTPNLDGTAAYAQRREYEQQLLSRRDDQTKVRACFSPSSRSDDFSRFPIEQLILAADQFIVKRAVPGNPDGRSVIAGYHWFGDWGRDTMIALPGLTLATGRPEIAANILRTFAHFVDQGMLPNRFPDAGEEPEYNTVDATLWYMEAIRAYHAATGDDQLLRDLFPVLQEIITWHQRGTRYQIHVDPQDGLLYAGEAGVQLTWMDAKVGDWVVTPRIGKPVEINALWYNALRSMSQFAHLLKQDTNVYEKLAQKVKEGFTRFWHNDLGFCYDVLDTPDGNDASLRPNQLFAVSLAYSPLNKTQQKSVVDLCARHLLTSHGLRSLAPTDPSYKGHYGGDFFQRDGTYHQGTVWGWLIGPFVQAHLRVYGDHAQARTFLTPLLHHLADHGLGSISEIFDGDAPFTPRGCIAQAWSVAEVLRTWQMTAVK